MAKADTSKDKDDAAAAAKAEADAKKAEAKTARTPITDAPKPDATVDETEQNPASGVAADSTLGDLAKRSEEVGRPIAAPPTPTVESALTANDQPGAGGSGIPQPRRRVALKDDVKMIWAKVTRPFKFLDEGHQEHDYDVGVHQMPADMLDHWWVKHHGVEEVPEPAPTPNPEANDVDTSGDSTGKKTAT